MARARPVASRSREIGHRRVELGVGLGLEGHADPLLELVRADPALGGRAMQAIDDGIPIRI
jgi:hypothetical protein